MQGAAGLEAVRVGGDAAHRVEGDRAAGHRRVAGAVDVGPGALEGDLALEGCLRELGGEAADRHRVEPAGGGDRLGREGGVEIGVGHQLEHGLGVGRADVEGAGERGPDVGAGPGDGLVAVAVPDELAARLVAQEAAEAGRARALVDEVGGVGVGAAGRAGRSCRRDIRHVDQAQDQEAVGAGGDAEPLVGDGAVAGADRVDRDDPRAAGLELAEADLDRVASRGPRRRRRGGGARSLPVGGAELPEGAAEGVDAGRRHVDRAEAAVRGVVRGAVLLRPPAGEGLALVAAGEEGELLRVLVAQGRQPVGGDAERLVPADLLELARAARAGAAQRRAQAGGREVLHDAGGALGAEDAAVDRVVAVALDVASPCRPVRCTSMPQRQAHM